MRSTTREVSGDAPDTIPGDYSFLESPPVYGTNFWEMALPEGEILSGTAYFGFGGNIMDVCKINVFTALASLTDLGETSDMGQSSIGVIYEDDTAETIFTGENNVSEGVYTSTIAEGIATRSGVKYVYYSSPLVQGPTVGAGEIYTNALSMIVTGVFYPDIPSPSKYFIGGAIAQPSR